MTRLVSVVDPNPKESEGFGRNTYERNESHSLENCQVKILDLESESGNGKKILDPNPKKMNSDPQHCV
jgi:hypothetical protein